MDASKQLREHFRGGNESTVAIVKLTTDKEGPPGREPVISEEEQRLLMAQQFRRQQEFKDVEEEVVDGDLQQAMHGLSKIKFRP